MIAHYGDINSKTFFRQLVNLKQKGLVTDYIKQFQQLSLRVKNISEDKLLYLFIGTLKYNIQHEVCLFEPSSLEKASMMARKVNKNMEITTRNSFSNTYREISVPYSKPPQRLTPNQLYEIRAKGLCFNNANKYSKVHKCNEKKLFYIDCEEEKPKEDEASQEEVTSEEIEEATLEEIIPTISCDALAGIITPQTLKIERYIKKKKETVLINEEGKIIFEREEITKIGTRQL